MIRFCRISPEAAEKFSAYSPHLVFSPDIWEQGRKFFAENPNVTQVPVTDRNGKLLCTAWSEEMAKQELRMLDEIISGGSSVYHFEDIYSGCDCVIINECNELAYYTAKYIKSRGIPVILRGRYWKYLDIESASEDIGYVNAMNIYADGTWEHTGDPRTEGIRSVSVEFDCIYYLYMKNVKDGRILRTSRTKEELFEHLKDKDIFLMGSNSYDMQDIYDVLLEHGIDVRGIIGQSRAFYCDIKKEYELSDEKLKRCRFPVIINCQFENSILGQGGLDAFAYKYGFRRDEDYIYIRDYVTVRKTYMLNIIKDKTVVLTGDKLLCRRLKRFLISKGISGDKVTDIEDYDGSESPENVFGLVAAAQIFGNVSQNMFSIFLALEKQLKEKNITNWSTYFSDFSVFSEMEAEDKKEITPALRPKGVVFGYILPLGGNVFIRDCIDDHPNIIHMGYNLFDANLFWYCVRLSEFDRSEMIDAFWEMAGKDFPNADKIFPDRQRFNAAFGKLLNLTDGNPSSRELFVILSAAYNEMRGRKTDNISDHYIYWEPHWTAISQKPVFMKWLNGSDIRGFILCVSRNVISRTGSRFRNLPEFSDLVAFMCTPSEIKDICIENTEVLRIRFEDVKTDPEKIWGGFCEKLGIPWSDTFLQTTVWGRTDSFSRKGNAPVTGYDLTPVIRDYSEYFSPFDKFRIQMCHACFQENEGYPYTSCLEFSRKEIQELFLKEFKIEKTLEFKNKAQKTSYYLKKFCSLRRVVLRNLYNKAVYNDFPEHRIAADPTEPERGFLIKTGAAGTGKMPAVYWLTGLSGAGKTTIGRLLYEHLKEKGCPVVFLDGDELRRVFGDDLGYSEEERRKSAMRNSRLCAMLGSQNISVVCCTISMFDSVRKWNRENIRNYREIYVRVSMDTLMKRDQKGLYSKAEQDVAGIHFNVEEPKCPDLILDNDGEKTPQEQVRAVEEKFGI